MTQNPFEPPLARTSDELGHLNIDQDFEVQVILSPEHILDAHKLVFEGNRSAIWAVIILAVLITAFPALYVILNFSITSLAFVGFPLALIAVTLIRYLQSIKSQEDRVASQALRKFGNDRHVVYLIDYETFGMKSSYQDAETLRSISDQCFTWSAFAGRRESENVMILIHHAMEIFILPLDQIPGEAIDMIRFQVRGDYTVSDINSGKSK